METVMVVADGFAWNGKAFDSLSAVAKAITGTKWNGHRFFGVRPQDRVAPDASTRSNVEIDGRAAGRDLEDLGKRERRRLPSRTPEPELRPSGARR
jgi:hypothetical protein